METVATPYAVLEEAREHMIALAKSAGQVQQDCGLGLTPDEFCNDTLKFGLMEVGSTPSSSSSSRAPYF